MCKAQFTFSMVSLVIYLVFNFKVVFLHVDLYAKSRMARSVSTPDREFGKYRRPPNTAAPISSPK